jgi:hypothetical protein
MVLDLSLASVLHLIAPILSTTLNLIIKLRVRKSVTDKICTHVTTMPLMSMPSIMVHMSSTSSSSEMVLVMP